MIIHSGAIRTKLSLTHLDLVLCHSRESNREETASTGCDVRPTNEISWRV